MERKLKNYLKSIVFLSEQEKDRVIQFMIKECEYEEEGIWDLPNYIYIMHRNLADRQRNLAID